MPRLNEKEDEGLKTDRAAKVGKTVAPIEQKQVTIDLISEQRQLGEKKDSVSSAQIKNLARKKVLQSAANPQGPASSLSGQ